MNQVAYCKFQGFDTISRSTSMSPPMFMDGRIQFGVGLSNVEFESKTSSCGRCIKVNSISNMPSFNQELTNWDYSKPIETPFLVYVIDQCTDPVCSSGYLDFDIYNPKQPVKNGNPYDVNWEFVECPVKEDTIEILFCLGPNSCNVQDQESQSIIELYQDTIENGYWFMYVRNSRLPINNITIQLEDEVYVLEDNSGWRWTDYEHRLELARVWKMTLESTEHKTVSFNVDWLLINESYSTQGYRGGFVFKTDIQV